MSNVDAARALVTVAIFGYSAGQYGNGDGEKGLAWMAGGFCTPFLYRLCGLGDLPIVPAVEFATLAVAWFYFPRARRQPSR